MSSDFEWRFGCDPPEDRGQEEQGSGRAWPRWLPWLLVLLLVAGSAYAWWRDRQRNLAQAEAQVRQVAQLELRALHENDGELYLSLQDPADRSWREAQEAYLDTRGLPLPLQDLTGPITTSVEGARIVGDRARIEIVHTATLPSRERASFRAVRFYRYTNEGRWLHTEADLDEMGHTVTFVLDEDRISVLSKDADWIDPLTLDLTGIPYRFCRLVPCRRSPSLNLNLAANLERAAEPDDPVLPAPFLVGAPENEAAQAAWEAGLGQFLVDHMIARRIGPRPADDHGGALVEERLRAWLKAELEVSQPTSPNLDLLRDALEDEAWIPLWRLWNVGPATPEHPLAAAEIDLLLAFVEEEHGAPAVAELLLYLRDADEVEDLLGHLKYPGRPSLEDRFTAYIRWRTATSTDDLSAFASYDLLIGCSEQAQSFRASGVWGWRLGSAQRVLLYAQPPDDGLVPISWSPDGTRLLLRGESSAKSRFFLLQAGNDVLEPMAIPSTAIPISGWLGRSGWSPDGSKLAYHVLKSSLATPAPIGLETRIVDFSAGEETTLHGTFIAWSPDGSRLLYSEPSGAATKPGGGLAGLPVGNFFVAEKDAVQPQRIGEGYAATWSPDGQQIAIIDAARTLTTYSLTGGRPTTLLSRSDLQATLGVTPTLPEADKTSFHIAWSPDGTWIAVGASEVGEDGPGRSAIVLARPGEHRLLREEPGRIVDLAWAPNGPWLHLFVYHGDHVWTSVIEPDGSLLLREEDGLVTWSPDGQHLALTRFGEWVTGLQILDVSSGERQRINLSGTCWPPIWNPRGPGREP